MLVLRVLLALETAHLVFRGGLGHLHVLKTNQVRCVHVPCHEVVLIKVIQVGRLVVLGVYLVHKILELDVACIREEARTVDVLHLGQLIVLLLIAVH